MFGLARTFTLPNRKLNRRRQRRCTEIIMRVYRRYTGGTPEIYRNPTVSPPVPHANTTNGWLCLHQEPRLPFALLRARAGSACRRLMVGSARAVKAEQLRIGGCELHVAACTCQLDRLLRRRHRFRESSRLGISRRQCAEHLRLLVVRQPTALLREPDRLRPVPHRGIRTRSQQPRQVVEGFRLIGLGRQQQAILSHRFAVLPCLKQQGSQLRARLCVRLQLAQLPKLFDRVVPPPLPCQSRSI